MPLPEGPGIAVSVDCFGPLPVTPPGNTYTLLFTGHFSRQADTFVVTAAEITAKGTASILISRCIPLWGCSRSILSDNGLHCSLKKSNVVYQLLGVLKVDTGPYHPNGKGGVKRVST